MLNFNSQNPPDLLDLWEVKINKQGSRLGATWGLKMDARQAAI